MEIRFFITDGKASRGSAYLVNGIGWDDEERFQAPNNDTMTRARRFAEMVARDTPSATGFSMDIGVRDDGTMFVIEANAAWPAPYGDYPVHVKGSVLASQDRTRPNSDTWRFDMSQIPGRFRVSRLGEQRTESFSSREENAPCREERIGWHFSAHPRGVQDGDSHTVTRD